MNIKQFLILIFSIYFVLNSFGLFLQEFNYLKIVIFINMALVPIGIFGFFYFLKVELIKKERPFEKFIDFLDLINTPICLYDENLKIIYVNKAFENFTNLKKDLVKNFQVDTWIVKNPLYLRLALVFFPSLIATKINAKEDMVEVNYQNQLVFDLITTKLKIDNEVYNSKIIIDKSLIAKELKEKNEFISLIAHHLRTPLNQIRWFLETFLQLENISEKDKEQLKNVLNIVSKSIILAESIIFTFKTEEKKIELEIEENDIEEILLSCLSLLNFEINEKKLNVNVEINENAKIFPFDKKILFFALYPILENAVDYNKEGGNVDIKIEKEGQEIKIEIKDTGIGIKDEDKKRIFEKFFRSQKAKDIKPTGTGLGLYLAKNLIEIHKGKIFLDSEENRGTTIFITLPSYKEVYL